MKRWLLLGVALGMFGHAQAGTIYASYTDSQRGVTVRDENLEQSDALSMDFAPSAIGDGIDGTFYTLSKNNIYHYDNKGAELAHFAWEDSTIKYTGVALHGMNIYVTYTGSQTGISVRDAETLEQSDVFPTPFAPSAIVVDDNGIIYLAARNHLYKYSNDGQLLIDMNFPDKTINYSGITVKGDKVYASYNGSQTGFTIRDNKLEQEDFVETRFSPTGIAAGDSNDVYLSTKDNLFRYSVDGKQLKKMNFPQITYTGVTFDTN